MPINVQMLRSSASKNMSYPKASIMSITLPTPIKITAG
jgi:hypothetical protein